MEAVKYLSAEPNLGLILQDLGTPDVHEVITLVKRRWHTRKLNRMVDPRRF